MDWTRIEAPTDEPTPGRFVWFGGRLMPVDEWEDLQEEAGEDARQQPPENKTDK